MAACRQMRGETYDHDHDFDLGTVALKREPETDYRQYPVGCFNRNEEISQIIKEIRLRLERRLQRKGIL